MERKIKCIAIDDEQPALRLIEEFAGRLGIALAAQFRNPLKAVEWLAANPADILFLDIQMPQLSGIELLKSLPAKPVVIFTTAYSEFAADAFDLDAADYLRKPFSFERFSKAIDKAVDYLDTTSQTAAQLLQNESKDNYLTIRANNAHVKVFFHEIIYVEGYQEYVKIFTEKARYITYERMKNMEALLPSSHFMRVHKSYIVALDRIRSVSGNLIEINDNQIPLSRQMKEELMKKIF
jgi:DNA-binding LytR/AlgR family response regulator